MGLLLSTFEYLLFIFFIASLIASHSDTYCEFFFAFFMQVLILLLYCLTFGRLTYVYDVKVFKVIPESMGSIFTAYRVNKHLGILTPRLERRYLRVLAAIENLFITQDQDTYIVKPDFYSLIIEYLPAA